MDNKKTVLEEPKEIFKIIFDEDRDGILLADAETKRFYMCNKMACKMLGYTEKEIMRLSVNDIHPEKDLPQVIEAFEKQARGDFKLAPNLPIKRKDGSVFYADVNTSPVVLSGKKYLMGSFRDVTERKKTEEKLEIQVWGQQKTNEAIKLLYKELERKNKEIEKLNQLKSDFVSTVSHELRTPLTSIKEAVSVVLDEITGSINEKQKRCLTVAQQDVDRLARLINDVLDFQKLESGKMTFNMQENDVNNVVKQVYESMSTLIKNKGLDFVLKQDDSLPKIRFDKDRIIQVITNLVNNAGKFTERGSITIITGRVNDFIEIKVQDTGLGIKEEDIQKLFQKFTQLEAGANSGIAGTGLGLAICKDIIEAHNGRIWAESEVGKGTSFIFTLPVDKRNHGT